MTVRGRLRFDEHVRRAALPLPVDIRYDDFTVDIDENRLLRAATHILRRLPVRRDEHRHRLRWLEGTLDEVRLVRYSRNAIPNPGITRVNGHYAPALALARVICTTPTSTCNMGTSPLPRCCSP